MAKKPRNRCPKCKRNGKVLYPQMHGLFRVFPFLGPIRAGRANQRRGPVDMGAKAGPTATGPSK